MVNFVNRSLIIFVLLGSLLASWCCGANNFSKNDLKVALVGQFIKNIEWPASSASQTFHLAVYADIPMFNTLSVLNGEVINQRKIQVQQVQRGEPLKNFDLVYFSKQASADLDTKLAIMRGRNTLVVTENSKSLHNVMINIIDNSSADAEEAQLSFQINRPNILFEKLKIKPQLILHGGSELDVATLYRETELAMQNLRVKNVKAQQQIANNQQALNKQQDEATSLKKALSQLKDTLASTQARVNEQEQQLSTSQIKLERISREYQNKITTSELLVTKAQQQLQANQLKVNQQVKLLSSLEQQVEVATQLLKAKEAKLTEKNTLVADQAAVINKQSNIIVSATSVIAMSLIALIIITWLFYKNSRTAKKLARAINELESTQEHLIEVEKNASLGQLVAGVAHEINTPLGVVVTSSSSIYDNAKQMKKMLAEKRLKKSDMEAFLDTLIETDRLMQTNLQRCSKMITNFKQVSADQIVAENRTIKVRDYIEEVMNILSVMMKQSNISWQVEGDNPEHYLDPGILAQVLNNLVNNAILHAFAGIEHPKISVQVSQTETGSQICFIDNGTGMTASTRKKIFDPFFTTKRGSGGTGLGMNIVFNLVTSKLHGTVKVESEQGQGCMIKITLPLEPPQ